VGLLPTKLIAMPPVVVVGAVVTTSETVAVCVSAPLVPVIVSVDVAAGVLDDVVTASVEVPDPVTVDGVKFAVVPAGSPLTDRLTVPLNPFDGVIVAV
jgi:hypothetical protein